MKLPATILLIVMIASPVLGQNWDNSVNAELDTTVELTPDRPLSLEVPEAGHVSFESEPGQPGVSFADEQKQELPNAVARTLGPTTLYARVESPTRGVFRFHPDSDQFEPNDTPELATPLDLGVWSRVSLPTVWDRDYFTVEFPERGSLVMLAHGVPDGVTPRIQTDGRSAAPDEPLDLNAGTHLVQLTSDKPFDEAMYISLRYQAPVDDLVVEEGRTPPLLELGKTYRIDPYRPAAVRKFRVVTTRTGRFQIEFPEFRPGAFEAILQIVNEGEAPTPIWSDTYLPAGEYTIQITELKNWLPAGSTTPTALRFIPLLLVNAGPGEPENDLPATAPLYPLNTRQNLDLNAADIDWYRIELDAPGNLQVVSTYPVDDSVTGWRARAVLYDGDGTTRLKVFEQGEDSAPFTPGTSIDRNFRIEKAGSYFILFSGGTTPAGVEVNFLSDLEGAPPPGESDGIAIRMIDISDNAGDRMEARMAATAGGAIYSGVEDVAALPEYLASALDPASEAAPRPQPGSEGSKGKGEEMDGAKGGSMAVWLAALGAVLLALIVGIVARRSGSAPS